MMKDPNMTFALGFIVVGIAFLVAVDPWFLGIAFLMIGGQRLFVALKGSGDD